MKMFGISTGKGRLAVMESEVNRLQQMVQKRNEEREALAKEKELANKIEELRKELGIA